MRMNALYPPGMQENTVGNGWNVYLGLTYFLDIRPNVTCQSIHYPRPTSAKSFRPRYYI